MVKLLNIEFPFCRCTADYTARRGNDCTFCAKDAQVFCVLLLSSSSRRTWIEIMVGNIGNVRRLVVLLAEDVD